MFSLLHQPEFCEEAKELPSDFTRHRKVGFVDVMAIIINQIRLTTQIELNRYREEFLPESAAKTSYTKQSFAEARQKIRPEAFVSLNNALVDRYYADPDYETFHGFRVLAIDGCGIEVPDVPACRETFGVAKGSGGFVAACARSSQLYDVFNQIVLDARLMPYRTGERVMAYAHLQALLSKVSATIPTLILFDRGYPSLSLICFLLHHHLHFLMRVSRRFYPQILGKAASNATVTLRVWAAPARELKCSGDPGGTGYGGNATRSRGNLARWHHRGLGHRRDGRRPSRGCHGAVVL